MTDALPLIVLIWALGRGGGVSMPAQTRKVRRKKHSEPRWPSTKSPPPIPAFQPKQTRSPADPTGSSTPLAQLHKAPPQVERPKTVLETAKSRALSTVKNRASNLLRTRAASLSINPFAKRSAPMSTALVSNLQQIINNHGANLTRDGLYGPRTASAWQSLARRKGLDPAIKREGPKIAKVVTATFERLQVPPIP